VVEAAGRRSRPEAGGSIRSREGSMFYDEYRKDGTALAYMVIPAV
jgi:hypothetical protein